MQLGATHFREIRRPWHYQTVSHTYHEMEVKHLHVHAKLKPLHTSEGVVVSLEKPTVTLSKADAIKASDRMLVMMESTPTVR